MIDPSQDLFERFRSLSYHDLRLGLALDVSRIHFAPGFFESMAPRVERALASMAELEAGAVANPDEKRMVGHYWLRAPELAPDPALREAIAGISTTPGLDSGVSASFGVAGTTVSGYELWQLLAHADAALYQAKRAGRNCVAVFDPNNDLTRTTTDVPAMRAHNFG